MAGKTYKATVVVAPREGGHGGWWQGGKFWSANQQYEDVELSEEEVQGLARRPGVVVLIGGKAVKPTERTGPATTPVPLTADEQEALARYRADRERMVTAAQSASSTESAGLEFEKKKDALDRALAPGAPGGAATGVAGVSAATPLQDADILAGKPPPENTTLSGSPIQTGKKR